ncbi:MAG: sugar transferase [Bacteroidales bacterium]|nr:sugar transferase [Bacteroidota bacterium]MBL6950543.1 sugar transferase [Bacteroidales bacterium]
MEEAPAKRLKILYVGTDQTTIDQYQESGLFDVITMPNGLAAIYWLTDNTFRLFDFDKDTGIAPVYEETKEIDAILCESRIPGMKGLDFYQKIKLHKLYLKVPFILLAIFYEDNIKEEALDAGIDDCYKQGYYPQRLHSRILFLQKLKAEYVPKPIEAMIDQNLDAFKTPFLKRIFDIVVALFSLVFLSPIMILTILAIRLESKGKVYYLSKRVGANYKIFDFYKFRSMYFDADKRLKDVAHMNQYMTDTVEEKCAACEKLPEGEFCSPPVVETITVRGK